MSDALVSVIIPSFKMGQFIGEALESVGAQTYPHWEVIVVDDAGPEDGTRAAVEAFAAKHPDHRVEYIRHETNQGVSVARRTAFEAARGEYIAFLDADDAFLPEKLVQHVSALERHPECLLVHGPVIERGDKWSSHETSPEEIFRLSGKSFVHRGREDINLLNFNRISNSTVVARRSAISTADFPERFVFQFEDWFLWIRMAERGPFLYEPEPFTCYTSHAESFTTRLRTRAGVYAFARVELLLALFPHTRRAHERQALVDELVQILTQQMGCGTPEASGKIKSAGLRLHCALAKASLAAVLRRMGQRLALLFCRKGMP